MLIHMGVCMLAMMGIYSTHAGFLLAEEVGGYLNSLITFSGGSMPPDSCSYLSYLDICMLHPQLFFVCLFVCFAFFSSLIVCLLTSFLPSSTYCNFKS